MCRPQGCLPLWPEEEAEVYLCHSSAGDGIAFGLRIKERKQKRTNKPLLAGGKKMEENLANAAKFVVNIQQDFGSKNLKKV